MKKITLAIAMLLVMLCFVTSCGQTKLTTSKPDAVSSAVSVNKSDAEVSEVSSSAAAVSQVSDVSSQPQSKAEVSKAVVSQKPDSKVTSSHTSAVDNFSIYNMKAAQLDRILKETNLKKWDIAWAPTPTPTFFDLNGTAPNTVPIWRGGKTPDSAFDDAGWGLIMNAFESQDDQTPGAYIYNKADVPANGKTLEVIARCNSDPKVLSGRGQFRIKAVYKKDGYYTSTALKIDFTDNQKAQADAAFKQSTDGWVTFEAPPKNDKCDAFLFDLSPVSGKSDVIFFIEVNDRMDKKGEGNTNLADRVIICAIRIK